MVPKSSSIAQVMGVTNAVTIDGEGIPPITLVGPGAGGAATASAVVADIADVARGIRAKPFGRPVALLRATEKAPMERHEGGYYIRLMARDLAGTAATIATRLAEQKISIESIVQRHPDGVDANGAAKKPSPVPVILITYATHEDAVYRALQAVQRDKVISGRCCLSARRSASRPARRSISPAIRARAPRCAPKTCRVRSRPWRWRMPARCCMRPTSTCRRSQSAPATPKAWSSLMHRLPTT